MLKLVVLTTSANSSSTASCSPRGRLSEFYLLSKLNFFVEAFEEVLRVEVLNVFSSVLQVVVGWLSRCNNVFIHHFLALPYIFAVQTHSLEDWGIVIHELAGFILVEEVEV